MERCGKHFDVLSVFGTNFRGRKGTQSNVRMLMVRFVSDGDLLYRDWLYMNCVPPLALITCFN